MASPIADLTYRNYDGPLEPPINRWWAIAKLSMRLSVKKRGFWGWSITSMYFYVILLIVFYFVETFAANAPGGNNLKILQGVNWDGQFLNAFSMSQIFLFCLALLMGAGTIANDNRAKALLVYLSKPCTKLDYVIGKWLGIFVPMTIVTAVPAFAFYAYCLLSYRSYGFWSQDPWLIVRLIALVLVPGICYSSLSLAVSSLFQQGRMAGAVFAGLYFLSNFVTKAMEAIIQMNGRGGDNSPTVVSNLFYCSVDGIQNAMAKVILHTNGASLLPLPNQPNSDRFVPEPSTWVILPLFFGICAAALALAWSQIRAVEVVR